MGLVTPPFPGSKEDRMFPFEKWIMRIVIPIVFILLGVFVVQIYKNVKNTIYYNEQALLTNVDYQTIGTGGIWGGSEDFTIIEIDHTKKIKIRGTYNNLIKDKPITVTYRKRGAYVSVSDITQ